MLQIKVPAIDGWDERIEEFVSLPETTLVLEHSLISISKWESKWHKPFLGKDDKTPEQINDYIKCMTITSNVKPEVYDHLSADNIKDVINYINDSMTATTIKDHSGKKFSREIVTSELIYYWMVALNIPFECQKWQKERVFSKDGDVIWQCANCGHIVIGQKAPDVCPVCDHPQAYFQIKAENY